MATPSNRQTSTPTRIAAIGIVEQNAVAEQLRNARELLRKRRRRALYATLAYLLCAASLLNPISGQALYERKPWSMLLLVIFMVVQLAWMVLMMAFGKAWSYKLNMEKQAKRAHL
jgi:uncharacterized membrane protein